MKNEQYKFIMAVVLVVLAIWLLYEFNSEIENYLIKLTKI